MPHKMSLPVVAFLRRGICRTTTQMSTRYSEMLGLYTQCVLPIFVLLVAIFLRVHHLDDIPRGLTPDEAWNGVDALRILDGERPIFLTANFGREALFIYLQAVSVAFLGQTSLALRAVSAIIGIITIVAAYFLVWRMFSARVALLASGWLSISIWHVIFSRTGLRSVSLPLFLAVGFYCIWRGLESVKIQAGARHSSKLPTTTSTGPAIWFAVGGIVIGLSLYTYSVARFAPFVILALALYLAFLHPQLLPRALPGLALALTLATIVFLPQGLFFLRHPESFLERAQDVWVFNPTLHQGTPAQALFDSTIRSIGMFAIRGDPGWPHNISGRPVFDPISALLMLVGLGLALRRFRQPAYGFIIIWLVVMFVPSLLAITYTPNYLRASALIPALFVLPALGANWLWGAWESCVFVRQFSRPRILRALPVILATLAFLGGAYHTHYSYFGLWAKSPELPQFFNLDRLVPFEAARTIVKTEQKLVFVGGNDYDDPWVYPWLRFIFLNQPDAKNIRTFDYEKTIIFPAGNAGAGYLFTFDLPPASTMERYFDETSIRIVDTSPSGRPIELHSLLDPIPPFEPEWPVPARFGDRIFVYGFDMPKDVRAGDTLTVQWYWRILATDEREFAFSNQLLDEDDRRHGQLDDRAFAPGYWPPGTSGITTFEIDIDPEAPTGAYWLRVAMYDRNKQDISNLPVFDAQGNQAGNHLILGPIKVHGQPPVPSSQGPVSDPRVPDNLLPARFDDQIDLRGYNLSVDRLLLGESLDLTLFWAPRGRPMRDYTVFVHLLDSSGQLRAQADSPAASGKYPTSVWDAGEVIADLHTLSIAPDLPAGEYRVAIGLYDPQTGQRLSVVDEDGRILMDHVTISGLIVGGD